MCCIPAAMETKRSVLTDEKGLPLAAVLSGANTHDVKLLGETLDSLVIPRLRCEDVKIQNLCLDADYTGHQEEVGQGGYIAHIRPRGEEKRREEKEERAGMHPEFSCPALGRRGYTLVLQSFSQITGSL